MTAPMSPVLLGTHVLGRLQAARERVSRGWPSVALALAGPPTSTALARLQESEAARYASAPAEPWVQALTEALAAVDEARALWGTAPDTMPPAASGMAPCALELRMYLAPARACAEMRLAWEDTGGLSRAQAVCMLHLAVCLAEWRAHEQRHDAATAKARAELEQQSRARAAKAIWGAPAKKPSPEPGPRSLRDLASVSSAFDQWEEEDEP